MKKRNEDATIVKYILDPHVEQQQKELKADIEMGLKEFHNTMAKAENYNKSRGAVHQVVNLGKE